MPVIGLVQIGEDFGGQYYLPYSVGLLQAYAKVHFPGYGDFHFLPPVYKRESLDDLAGRLAIADLVVFSAYVWNHRYSIELARRIKAADTGTVIFYGGPQVPEAPTLLEPFLRDHSFLDLACYGEGEIPFVEVLRGLSGKDWRDVPTVARRHEGEIVIAQAARRIEDLDRIPSPYLEGIFDHLISSRPGERWQALLETNRGCPFTCSFCAWGSRNKRKVFAYSPERTFQEIDWISRNRIEFVFCCDANFGLFPERDMAIVRKVALNKRLHGYPKAFSVQSTKNATAAIFNLNKVLDEAGLQKGVNLALQSVNEATLRSVRRSNISNKVYDDLQRMFTAAGIATFSDIILGLPDETYGSFVDGVDAIIARGQHNRIQFINLSVLENSEMALPEYQRRHGLLISECRSVSHHSRIDVEPEIVETQRLVVGTSSMPPEDWIRAKVFCWLTSLLHFDKLFQIPSVVLNGIAGIRYREIVELFLDPDPRHGVLSGLRGVLEAKARSIQRGEGEYVASKEWLGLWWPADEYLLLKLTVEGAREAFYREAEEAVGAFLARRGVTLPPGLLADSIRLNAALLKRPGPPAGGWVRSEYSVWEWYLDRVQGGDSTLEAGGFVYKVNPERLAWTERDEWMREVVWYGGKRGAYLYSCIRDDGGEGS